MFCSCKYLLYEVIRTKRFNKVVNKFYCWIKLRVENGKFGRLDGFQIWMVDNTWGVPAKNNLIFPEILIDECNTHRISDLIFQYQPAVRRGDEGELIRSSHQIKI